ncbi:DDE superfamily endonuclease [Streptomyces sp. PanSC9]|nr:DDE superfamily endonuclease [Streptomyces sp. PanSC9]
MSFQRIKTWKTSRDPDYAAKKARVEHLYAIADGEVIPEDGEPEVVFCMDEFGPLNLQPHPGRQWAERGGRHKDPEREPRPRRRATSNRPDGVRHLFAAYDLGKDKLYGHIKPKKNRTRFLEFCRYLRSLYPPNIRIATVLDNFSPHLTTKKDSRVGDWAAANNVELAYTPTNSSWLNRIEAQFTALRYFALDGTDHASRKEQGSMIRRYIIWRNKHAADERLREVVDRSLANRLRGWSASIGPRWSMTRSAADLELPHRQVRAPVRRDQQGPVLQRQAPRPALADRIRTLPPRHRHQLAEVPRAQPCERGCPRRLRRRDHTRHRKITSPVTGSYGTGLRMGTCVRMKRNCGPL